MSRDLGAARRPDRAIRVASVPTGHPYVRHLSPVSGTDDVVRLPDPTDPWWPPAVLDRGWLRVHAEEIDVVHVHFGFDGTAPEDLDAIGRDLRRRGTPLVVTVHDLRNPHHPTPALHERQLGALLRHASAVLTLTHDAARVVAARHHRRAEVLAHPHVVELDDLRRRQARRGGVARRGTGTVGLHLKSLRPNMEPAVVDAAVAAVRRVPGAELRVDVHLDVAEPTGRRHAPDLLAHLRGLHDRGDLRLVAHDCFDDRGFVDYLASLRVSVLPYRFGTHSGWLEACRDLGVAVVAPDCGSYHDQGEVERYSCNEVSGFDPASCAAAVERALRAPPPVPVPWWERARQRDELAARHRRLYRSLLEQARGCRGCRRPAVGAVPARAAG